MMDYILKKEGIKYWLYQDDKLIAQTPIKSMDDFPCHEDFEAYWDALKKVDAMFEPANNRSLLNLEQIHSLLGIVDVEKKAMEMVKNIDDNAARTLAKITYKYGYNQSLEDNKNKKWTDEDMNSMYLQAIAMGQIMAKREDYQPLGFKEMLLQFIPKTEWEVEVEEVEHMKRVPHDGTMSRNESSLRAFKTPKIINGYINILKIIK